MTSLRLDRVEVGVGASFRLGPLQLDLDPGEYLGILGPSGSGKSTLLRAIAGLAPLASGSIRLGDTLIEGPGERLAPERRRVGMVFQSLALWPHLSAQEHLQLVLEASPVPKDQRAARAAGILEKMRIGHRKDRKPPELSGGEAQRLALARALAGEPRILLLDEPLGQLDPLLRQELAEELRRIHQETRIPVLHVTHDPAELAGLAHRVALLHEGLIEQIGTWRDLLDRPATPFVSRFLDPMRRLLELVQSPREGKK